MFNPKTVSAAIAPFAKVITNLKCVIEAQQAAASTAETALDAARINFEDYEKKKIAERNNAEDESRKARSLMAKLEALLDDDDDSTASEDTASMNSN